MVREEKGAPVSGGLRGHICHLCGLVRGGSRTALVRVGGGGASYSNVLSEAASLPQFSREKVAQTPTAVVTVVYRATSCSLMLLDNVPFGDPGRTHNSWRALEVWSPMIWPWKKVSVWARIPPATSGTCIHEGR